MVTIESLTKIGLYSWLLKYSSDLENPMFYIYLDGGLIAETPQTQYNIAINIDEGSVIEVLDDVNAQPMQIFPGKVRLGWFWVAGTDYYRVDEYIGNAWVERYRIPESGGYLSWQSRFLEDGQTHLFRIVPVGTNGNEGISKYFAVLMCRRPDVPDAGYGYNEGAGKVIIYDKDSPPNDLMFHCVAHYKMNDNAANTTVIDSMKNSDGTAQRNTNLMHIAGKVGGALNFNGSSDYINTNSDFQSVFQDSFTISFWCNLDTKSLVADRNFLGNADTINGLSAVNCFRTYEGEGVIFLYRAAGSELQITSNYDLNISTWYHIVCVVEKVSSSVVRISVYVNGLLKATDTENIDMVAYSNIYNLFLGQFNTNGEPAAFDEYFDGSLDDMRIFNKALSQDDINFLYNGGDGRGDF